jgi:ATP-binding cassette subfamily B protein
VVRIVSEDFPVLAATLAIWTLARAFLPVASLFAMGRMVTDLGAASAQASGTLHRLALATVVFAVVYVLSTLLTPVYSALEAAGRVRMSYRMQHRLMRAVSGPIGIAHLEDPNVTDAIVNAEGSLLSYNPGDAPSALAQVTAIRLWGLGCCLAVGLFRWWVAILLTLGWLCVRRPVRNMTRATRRAWGLETQVMRRAWYFSELSTSASVAKEVRVFGLANWMVSEFRRHWFDGMTRIWSARRGVYRQVGVIFVILLAASVGLYAYVAREAYIGLVSLGTLAVVLNVLSISRYLGTASALDTSLEFTVSTVPSLDQLEADLHSREEQFVGNTPAGTRPRESIRFERVGFTYPGSAHPVFEGLDLELQAGKSTALVGANGVGKTTLVKVLCRLHDPSSGRILVDGLDLRELDATSWQRRVAVVFQDFNRYPVSARENVSFGAFEHRDDEEGIRQAASDAGALEFVEAMPMGFDTVLSRNYVGGIEPSGGQWQRIALARALFAARHGAGVLVLDEPTAWLDVRGEADFYERFLDITHGLTTVVISHRFSTVRLADRICVIEGGTVVEQGAHDQLMTENGRYAQMFRLQAERLTDVPATEEQP